MSRFDITLGMLSILGAVILISILAMGEAARMPRDSRGFETRKVETGAVMFDQYCSNCHGPNASGGVCPPLDETSGLHGGELGEGIAWRLEELGWDRQSSYEYVYSAIESGRTVSSRPDQYPGNRTADAAQQMAMPSWGQDYGGPLRADQIGALAHYIVAFGDAIPEDATPRATDEPEPTSRPTSAPVLSRAGRTATEAADEEATDEASGSLRERIGGNVTQEATETPRDQAAQEQTEEAATATPGR
jgi:hypothetical protein